MPRSPGEDSILEDRNHPRLQNENRENSEFYSLGQRDRPSGRASQMGEQCSIAKEGRKGRPPLKDPLCLLLSDHPNFQVVELGILHS
mmetsp:Transcript_16695/g.36824  ORF Transcript_16695/g.36824 Transcript_16695/m.36824 type:complete len:87 (-) Transcript_16695:46-306(-)